MPSQDSRAANRLSHISSHMESSRFKDVPLAPPDAILGMFLCCPLKEGQADKADKDERVVMFMSGDVDCLENQFGSWSVS